MGKKISTETAKVLRKNWQDDRDPVLEKHLKRKDISDFWFSIEELEQYLNEVKQLSEEQGVVNPGIRIFFGCYSKNDNQPERKDRATVFLAPTKEVRNSPVKQLNNYSIDPYNDSNGGHPPNDYLP